MKNIKSFFSHLTAKHIYKIVSVLFTIIVSLLILLIIKANNMAHNNPSRIAAINEIITDTTSAHLWFEEIVGGDTHENIGNVFKLLDSARKNIQNLQIQNKDKITKVLEDPLNKEIILHVDEHLKEFVQATNQRYHNINLSRSGSDIDQRYDFMYKDMIDDLQTLKQRLIAKQLQEKENFSTIQYMILIFEIISFSLVSLAIYSYTKSKEALIQKDKILIRQSKMVIMGEMIENIAHQWRQPLSFISTMASSIQMEKEHNILKEEKLVENMESILSNVNYLSQTIDDFRHFYKSDQKKSYFHIDTALENIFKIIKFDKNHEQIEYLKKEYTNIEVHTYKNELLQVLINIISNAKDQLTENQNLCHLDKVVYFSAKKEKRHHIISIHDNGGGIKEELLDNIFNAYFTTKGEIKGTGIGLYISKDIIENYLGGSIEVINEKLLYKNIEYLGAKFIIKIPE